MSDPLWSVFSELARRYQKVAYKQRGLDSSVEVVHKDRTATVFDFQAGWWLELRNDETVAIEKAVETVDELFSAIREWLGR